MESDFNILHDFMLHTKNITYLLIVAALVGIAAFWRFLSGKDRENDLGVEGEESKHV